MVTGFGNISISGSSEKNGVGKIDGGGMRMTRSGKETQYALFMFIFF